MFFSPLFLSNESVHGEVGGESIVGISGVRCFLRNGDREFFLAKTFEIGASVFSGLYEGSRLELEGGVVVGLWRALVAGDIKLWMEGRRGILVEDAVWLLSMLRSILKMKFGGSLIVMEIDRR